MTGGLARYLRRGRSNLLLINSHAQSANMKISVVGSGYVGLVSAVGWAGLGHDITCIDTDQAKVAMINRGEPPIFEEGLEKRLQSSIKNKKLVARADYASVASADIILISVGTPSRDDGSMDDKYILMCSQQIGAELKKAPAARYPVIVVRSTVLPGTTENSVGPAVARASGRSAGTGFGLSMIPEFLKEGSALDDFDRPDRIVLGCSDEKTAEVLGELHKTFSCPKLFTSIKTAEMTKYASNSFLAAKVSFANEMAVICEKLGIDVDEVMAGVGLDSRIGPKFLVAGAGFGGSCFPKDVKAIIAHANAAGLRPVLLESVMEVNKIAQRRLVDMLAGRMRLKGKRIAVLGLAFKAGTDDVRESSSLVAVRALLDAGALVRAYDPEAMEGMKKLLPQAEYAASWADCLAGCDAALLITAWPEFKKSAAEYKKALGDAPLFDARRVLKALDAKAAGLDYHCVGRGEAGGMPAARRTGGMK